MEKKKLIILAVSMLLLIGVFAVIAVTITNSETGTQAGADAKETEKKAENDAVMEKMAAILY